MDTTPEPLPAARALPRLEGAELALYEDLRAISFCSAARLQGCEVLTEADLYDGDRLPG